MHHDLSHFCPKHKFAALIGIGNAKMVKNAGKSIY